MFIIITAAFLSCGFYAGNFLFSKSIK